MKKLKNVLLVLTMTVLCLVLYYVAIIFMDISKLVRDETATSMIDKETQKNEQSETGDDNQEGNEEKDKNKISIVVFGENFVHDSVINSGKQSDGTYNYDFLFDNLRAYANEADVAAIYQTTIIGGNDLGVKGYPDFNTPVEMMDAIKNAGFDVAIMGSNHSNDMGTAAIKNCVSLWKNKGIKPIGINDSKEEGSNIPIVEVKGVKIAMLNYTAGMNKPIENADDKYMVNQFVKDNVVADIAKAEEEADYVVVFPYWMAEYTHDTTDSQRTLAKAMTEAGADLIIGASSRFIGEIEKIETDNGNVSMCYYSIGNFCSSFNYADAMVGGIAKITLNIEGDTLTVNEECTGMIPIVTHYTHTVGDEDAVIVGVYPKSIYTEEMASNHGIITRAGIQFNMEIIEKIIAENIKEKYLLEK